MAKSDNFWACVWAGLAMLPMMVSAQMVGADDRRLQQQSDEQLVFEMSTPSMPTPSTPETASVLEVDEKQLLDNPALLSRALLSALVADSAEQVAVVLPIYEKQPATDIEPDMIIWAKAVLARGEHRPDEAVGHYRALLDKYPHHALFSVRLGQAYFANRHHAEALELFEAQDDAIKHELMPYINAIKKQQKLRTSFAMNMINDKNINNAPKQRDLGGGWTADEPQASRGIALDVAVDKSYLLPDGVVFRPQLSLHTKRHQDTKHYDEMSLKASSAIGVHDHQHSLTVTPFYERMYYAGGQKQHHKMRHFSDHVGIGVDYDWRASRALTLSLSTQLTQNHHQARKHLEGHSVSISPMMSVAGDDWLGRLAVDYQKTHAQDKDDSFVRYGVRGSLMKQWGQLGVQGHVGLARREYQAVMPIFNKTQINDEWQAGVSLWHDKIRYKQFVPRLSYHYQKTDSTIGLYSYDKGRLFVEVTGRF